LPDIIKQEIRSTDFRLNEQLFEEVMKQAGG